MHRGAIAARQPHKLEIPVQFGTELPSESEVVGPRLSLRVVDGVKEACTPK